MCHRATGGKFSGDRSTVLIVVCRGVCVVTLHWPAL